MKIRFPVVKERNETIVRIVQCTFKHTLSMVTEYTTARLYTEAILLDKQFFVCNVRCS